jgi:DNA-binding TFAR19-related protein (PDSD5 family)
MRTDLVENIRKRVAQCRRVADSINDSEVRTILLQMAADGEADIRKLQAEDGQ